MAIAIASYRIFGHRTPRLLILPIVSICVLAGATQLLHADECTSAANMLVGHGGLGNEKETVCNGKDVDGDPGPLNVVPPDGPANTSTGSLANPQLHIPSVPLKSGPVAKSTQPPPATVPPATVAMALDASPVDFRSLHSNLGDCNIAFDDLKAKSPSCTVPRDLHGGRCEQYSSSQFTEVVRLEIAGQVCTGTLIAADWVVTAAHCLIGEVATAAKAGRPNADFALSGSELAEAEVYADKATTLAVPQRRATTAAAIVYRGYRGRTEGAGSFDGDVALLRLETAYPLTAVEPALLAKSQTTTSPGTAGTATTIAGYGYSNENGGHLRVFNVTWPAPIIHDGLQFRLNPQDTPSTPSGFCKGDSGGPVFLGRSRGCPATTGETRPRRLLAAVSNARLAPESDGKPRAAAVSESCLRSTEMRMTDLSLPAIRKWICDSTANRAGGCAE